MKRPEKYKIDDIGDKRFEDIEVYFPSDIDPLLDELEQMKADKKPFPSLQEFTKWYQDNTEFINWGVSFYLKPILQYFSQFQYEKITPTREEVIAKYGLTDSDLKALGFDNNLINWIIENTEDVTGQDGVKWNCIERDELLNYLKGQDNE